MRAHKGLRSCSVGSPGGVRGSASFTLLRIPATTMGFKGPGALVIVFCFLMNNHIRFSELTLGFKSFLSFPPE